jgi:PTS system ascorbate-specific IIA component
MPRLLVIAHVPLASAFRSVASHVYPEAAGEVIAIDVQPAQSCEAVDDQLREVLAPLEGQEVLVLADVFGATPCNVAQRLAERPNTRVITGANVPMLWRALSYRDEPLERLCALAMAGATQGVIQLAPTRRPDSDEPVLR